MRAMYPILFFISGRPLTSWAFFVWMGICFGFLSLNFNLRKRGISKIQIRGFFLGCVLAWFVGGHIGQLLTVGSSTSLSGYVLYGGMILVILFGFVAWLLLDWKRWIRVRDLFDVGTLALCVVSFFGRLGCFFYGCCYGSPVNVMSLWPRYFLNADRWDDSAHAFPVELLHVPLHPAALYEAISFLFLVYLYNWIRRNQSKFPILLPVGSYGLYSWMIYGGVRFSLEWIRQDPRGSFLYGLSPSQWIAALTWAVGLALIAYSRTPWGYFLIRKTNTRLKT